MSARKGRTEKSASVLKNTPGQILKPVTVSLALVLSAPVTNAAWDIYPEATLEAGLDDNVRMTPDNLAAVSQDEASTGSLEGKLIVRNVTETSSVRATAAARRTEFGGTDLPGNTSAAAMLNAEKRTERISYGVVANYTSQPLRRTGAIDLSTGQVLGAAEQLIAQEQVSLTTDPNLEIGFIEDEIRQKRAFLSPFVSFSLSARNRLRVAAEFSDIQFSGDSIVGLEDSQQFGGNAALTYQLDERSTVTGKVATRKFEPDNSPHVKRHDATLGYARQFSERTRFEIEAGLSFIDSDNGEEDTVGIYRATLLRRFERGQLYVLAERNNWPTGFGNVVQTDLLQADWNQPLTERLALQVRGTFTTTDSNLQDATNPNDRDYADLETRLSYALTPAWKVGVAHRFRWLDQKLQPKDATGNAAFLFLSYSPPRPF